MHFTSTKCVSVVARVTIPENFPQPLHLKVVEFIASSKKDGSMIYSSKDTLIFSAGVTLTSSYLL